MKIKFLLLSTILLFSFGIGNAQEEIPLSLDQAVNIALSSSNEAKIAETSVKIATHETQVAKNNQYPDFDISGQYKYLTNATVDLQLSTVNNNAEGEEAQPAAAPDVSQLLLGQANISLPVFSGFKIKNAVEASKNLLQAATSNAENDKAEIALQTIKNYINLYKARKSVNLLGENLKSAQQRVKDFEALEENGLLARNDFLKSQLQEANVELLLEEAKKNERILNFALVRTLQLPEETKIVTTDVTFGLVPELSSEAISRSDLEAIRFQEKAAENQIKIAKSKFYPSVGLVGGYMALDLKNALTVTNAMNIGVGISYNIADIFKAKSDVKVAESKAEKIQHTLNMLSDKVQVQVKQAEQDYQLALRKFEVYTQSAVQATENFRIVNDKYENGLSDTNDLLEADVQQLQAKINLAYSRADITQKYYELLFAEGNLTNTFSKN